MHQIIKTKHGNLAVEESTGRGTTILFIHGNSSCKEVFRNQMSGKIGQQYHCFALDLPGHGKSEDSPDPESSYHMSGYAGAVLEVMTQVHDDPFVVVGWSLGGHIGIEMLSQSNQVTGLMISGTPPVSTPDDMALAFLPNEHMAFTGEEFLTEQQADLYAHTTCGDRYYEDFLGEAVRRTDGRARRIMMAAALAGLGVDQKSLVETTQVPVAVVNGNDEPLVNNGYLQTLNFSSLWRQQIQLINNAGHAPFWDEPTAFDQLLSVFIDDIS